MANTHSSVGTGPVQDAPVAERIRVLVTPFGPVMHRVTAKISAGSNPADNFQIAPTSADRTA